MRDHEVHCPSRQWTRWWQVWWESQDCQCGLIRRVQAAQRKRLAAEVDALGTWIREVDEEPYVRVEDVLNLLVDDEDKENDE